MLPGMRARRASARPGACASDQGVCRSVAVSKSATRLPAVASAISTPSGPNAAAVSGAPSCTPPRGSARYKYCGALSGNGFRENQSKLWS